MRRAGYLANLLTIPPLIFRFQFNPKMLSDKKSFKYVSEKSFGEWGFDKTSAASGLFSSIGGVSDDLKEIGSLLVGVHPLKPEGGGDRTLAIEFELDATRPGPLDGDSHYNGSIAPDLAILRSFMVPTWDLIDVAKMIGTKKVKCWQKPPECSFTYGGISTTCVMTDLNIKVIAFQDDASPARAEVSLTLKEQPYSLAPLLDLPTRMYQAGRGLVRANFDEDLAEISGYNAIADIF